MFLEIPWTEWLGYAASIVVAISLLMKSLLRLRWINLAGSALFAAYGFLIGAWPVGGFNTAIIFINIWFLIRIYRTQELFELMEVRPGDLYLTRFLEHHRTDIGRFFPSFDPARHLPVEGSDMAPANPGIGFYVLRDLSTAGVFLGTLDDNGQLDIVLDYVTPAYRDYKSGRYLFSACLTRLSARGVKKLSAVASTRQHADYLARMGFKKEGDRFVLSM